MPKKQHQGGLDEIRARSEKKKQKQNMRSSASEITEEQKKRERKKILLLVCQLVKYTRTLIDLLFFRIFVIISLRKFFR